VFVSCYFLQRRFSRAASGGGGGYRGRRSCLSWWWCFTGPSMSSYSRRGPQHDQDLNNPAVLPLARSSPTPGSNQRPSSFWPKALRLPAQSNRVLPQWKPRSQFEFPESSQQGGRGMWIWEDWSHSAAAGALDMRGEQLLDRRPRRRPGLGDTWCGKPGRCSVADFLQEAQGDQAE
jgi:hypothetical protein